MGKILKAPSSKMQKGTLQKKIRLGQRGTNLFDRIIRFVKMPKKPFGSNIVMLPSHQERVIVAIPSILRILPEVKDDPVLEPMAFVPFGISVKI